MKVSQFLFIKFLHFYMIQVIGVVARLDKLAGKTVLSFGGLGSPTLGNATDH